MLRDDRATPDAGGPRASASGRIKAPGRAAPRGGVMDVLLTWVGRRDPAWREPQSGQAQPGPVLSLLSARRFQRVHLLVTPGLDDGRLAAAATALQRACRRQLPATEVRTRPVDLVDPTDYTEVYRATYDACRRILDAEADERRQIEAAGRHWRYYVYLQPGTGQMQTVWVLLVQAGLLPATLLARAEGRYRLPSEPAWREVDLTLAEFPAVVRPGELERRAGLLERQNENLRRTVQALEADLAAARSGPASLEMADGEIPPGFSWPAHRDALEQRYYARAFAQAAGDVPRAAALLGISPATFRAAAERLGIRSRHTRAGDGGE